VTVRLPARFGALRRVDKAVLDAQGAARLNINRCRPNYALCIYFRALTVLLPVISLSGCGGTAGDGTSVSPGAAAEKAIELLDRDGSGSLNETELAASPGILAARDRYDADGNGEVSEDEIEAQLNTIYFSGTSWLTADCQVFQGARPLAGATVRFVPEPFLEEAISPAEGKTGSDGRVNPAAPDEKLPDNLKGLLVMQPGLYRVEVVHPSIKQPHKPLGCEISDAERDGTRPVFRL
jgi:hypothetical protein